MKAERALTLGVWKGLREGRKGLNFGSMDGPQWRQKGPYLWEYGRASVKAERALTLGVWKGLSEGRKGLNFGSMEGPQ